MAEDVRFPYQDATLPIDQRVADLLARMTLEDKAGLMFQPLAPIGDVDAPGLFGAPSLRQLLVKRINHANILQAGSAREIAEWHNLVQREAAATPLGIPFTVSSDPRHSFSDNPATALMAGPYSQWPEFLGFGALDDTELTERFADVVRREYLATGIRLALHPQLDLATEPRWGRANTTFGESAEVAGRLGAAYVRGLQGGGELGAESVSAMVKHFPGGGPQLDGEDPHFDYGREQVYPGDRFDLHLQPFREVFSEGASQVMPYYGMPIGTEYEEVGFSFNKQIITGLLREQLGFEGVVCTDWGVLSRTFWGVESLTYEERMLKSLDAGVDQFGGEFRPGVLVQLVRSGQVAEDRIDTSVRRLLREKFRLGLFENRFVDAEAADSLVGTAEARAAGLDTQAAAIVLLKNEAGIAHLPLSGQPNLYVEGIDPHEFAGWANVVLTPEEADAAVIRTVAPWEQRGKPGDIEFFFHAGSLEFHEDELSHLRDIASKVPTIVDVYMDRPAILGPVADVAATLTVNFGASPEAFTSVLFGAAQPKGGLPFDIPVSMAAVEASRPDVPFDTENPNFRFGDGLRFHDWSPAERPDRTSTTIVEAATTTRYELHKASLKTVLADAEAREIFDELLPGLSHNPMIALADGMPVGTILAMADAPADVVDQVRDRLSALLPL